MKTMITLFYFLIFSLLVNVEAHADTNSNEIYEAMFSRADIEGCSGYQAPFSYPIESAVIDLQSHVESANEIVQELARQASGDMTDSSLQREAAETFSQVYSYLICLCSDMAPEIHRMSSRIISTALSSANEHELISAESVFRNSDYRRQVYLENLSEDYATVSEINNLLTLSVQPMFDLIYTVTNMRSIRALELRAGRTSSALSMDPVVSSALADSSESLSDLKRQISAYCSASGFFQELVCVSRN